MTTNDMRIAAQLSNKSTLTDEELALAIKGNALTLAFLEGKGDMYALAIPPLRRDREFLERYDDYRKKQLGSLRNKVPTQCYNGDGI